jgi:hypothetical protein
METWNRSFMQYVAIHKLPTRSPETALTRFATQHQIAGRSCGMGAKAYSQLNFSREDWYETYHEIENQPTNLELFSPPPAVTLGPGPARRVTQPSPLSVPSHHADVQHGRNGIYCRSCNLQYWHATGGDDDTRMPIVKSTIADATRTTGKTANVTMDADDNNDFDLR